MSNYSHHTGEDSLQKTTGGKITVSGIIAGIIWTLLVVISVMWNANNQFDQSRQHALVQARATFEKDILYRRWNALHGGVYVQVSDSTKPNEYLRVPYRDIENQLVAH